MACPLQTLVEDVQLYTITQFLNTPDLLSLATVSRHWNKITTPTLYVYISLLLHISCVPIQISQWDNGPTLQRAQRALWGTLVKRPELALHVRTLEWEVHMSDEVHDMPANREERSRLFNTLFPLFRNVTRLYLIDLDGQFFSRLVPSALFPRVTSVKLRGGVSPETTKVIFHCPTQICELSLDKIWPFHHKSQTETLRWLAKTPFPALRRLSLRYGPVPQDEDPASATELMEIFSAWNDLLRASRPTLRDVLLGFRDPVPGCVYYMREDDAASLVESTFVGVVGPVFSEAEWPALRVLELEGMGSLPGLWEPLERAVPRLVRDPQRQLVIERWEVTSKAKF